MTTLPPRTTWIEVSRAALHNNVAQLRAALTGHTPLMGVVKANAYGHGAVATAATVQDAGVECFAVATLGEAIELREGGITRPILVLGYTPARQTSEALQHRITLTVFDPTTAAEMDRLAAQRAARLTVHVKINTGMNRLGLPPEEALAFLQLLDGLRNLVVEGIFTHFATSDELDKAYAEYQFGRFSDLLNQLTSARLRPPVAHAANSAALLTMPQTHLDLVRSGIALYGLDPDMEQCALPLGFQPALRWKAVVTHVSTLQPGEPVSYGREFIAERTLRTAVIPVGYADGFPRRPRTWGSVLIRGREAPILGRVCMDQTVVDITAIEAATGAITQGEEVVLIGRQCDAVLTAEAVSVRVGTNNYDVVSRILARVPRLLVDA